MIHDMTVITLAEE